MVESSGHAAETQHKHDEAIRLEEREICAKFAEECAAHVEDCDMKHKDMDALVRTGLLTAKYIAYALRNMEGEEQVAERLLHLAIAEQQNRSLK